MNIQLENVMSVYAGRPGCMCGCRGKHTYASKYVCEASKDRGYEVTPDEVSDRTIKIIVNKLAKNEDTEYDDGMFYLDTPTRSYVVYMKKEK